jgi:hypothetical protein
LIDAEIDEKGSESFTMEAIAGLEKGNLELLWRTLAVAPELGTSQRSYRTSATGERTSGMAGGSRSWRG